MENMELMKLTPEKVGTFLLSLQSVRLQCNVSKGLISTVMNSQRFYT